jgi:hypothetical protein
MPPATKTGFGPFNYVQDWKNIDTDRALWNSDRIPVSVVERAPAADAQHVNATVPSSSAGDRVTVSVGGAVPEAVGLRVFSQ